MYFYHINEKHLSNQGAEITNLFLFFKLIAKCVQQSTNSPATDPMIHNKKKRSAARPRGSWIFGSGGHRRAVHAVTGLSGLRGLVEGRALLDM